MTCETNRNLVKRCHFYHDNMYNSGVKMSVIAEKMYANTNKHGNGKNRKVIF